LIAISDGTVTIASDDTEALDLFESLLRSMSQRSGSVGRNIAVYSLKNTSAASVAATLQQLFRTGRGEGAGANGAMGAVGRRGRGPMGALGTLVIVPDERTNSILVQGSRAERNAIENFLKVLDSAELPPALAAQKPRTIAIQNTNAARIAELVRSIFRAQLTPGTGRGAGAAPSWLATDLTVDDVTNSLIVTGPKPLVDAIEQFAVSTDEAARDDKSREVVIISLKKASADRVQQVLDAMMKRASTPRAGSSRSSTSRSPQSPPAPAPSPSPPRRNSP
jgi:type II secretory pathway component GspD/PulD (secretin)